MEDECLVVYGSGMWSGGVAEGWNEWDVVIY